MLFLKRLCSISPAQGGISQNPDTTKVSHLSLYICRIWIDFHGMPQLGCVIFLILPDQLYLFSFVIQLVSELHLTDAFLYSFVGYLILIP